MTSLPLAERFAQRSKYFARCARSLVVSLFLVPNRRVSGLCSSQFPHPQPLFSLSWVSAQIDVNPVAAVVLVAIDELQGATKVAERTGVPVHSLFAFVDADP